MITVQTRRQLVFYAIQVADLVIFSATLMFALYIEGKEWQVLIHPPTWALFGWFLSALVVWHFCLVGAHLYRSHRLAGGFPVVEILMGVSMGSVGVGVLALLFRPGWINLEVIVHLWWMSGASIIVLRALFWYSLVSLRRRGRNVHNVLVVGSGQRATQLIKLICHPSTGYFVVGYIDEPRQSQSEELNGIEYLGTVAMLPSILAARVIDEVFIVLPMRSHYDSTAQVIQHCEEQGIPLRIPFDLFVPGHCAQYVDVIEGLPILSLAPSDAPQWYDFIKRIIDMSVAAALLILLVPLFILVALLIKLDSPGPVCFVQRRVGLNKRLFPLIKFRTMELNSEARMHEIEHLNEADGPVFKIRNDPRVTRVGRFLRRTSIDELPQLLNVLVGHMSLVGPRPLPLRDVEGFKLHWQRRRFSVPPGITCLWQIYGRSSIPFDQWMELDLFYIEHRSLLLDFKILLQTIPTVLKRAGAY